MSASPPSARAAYRLVTDRLVARCFDPSDAPALHDAVAASAAELAPWMPWMHPEPPTLEGELELLRRWRSDFDRNASFVYAILERASEELVGSAGLHAGPEPNAFAIGYWIRSDRHRRGYASEAAGALTRAAFELLRAELVEIRCEPANEASAGVARKLGFHRDGLLRRRIRWPDGARRDEERWSLFADEYAASASACAVVEGYDALGRRLF